MTWCSRCSPSRRPGGPRPWCYSSAATSGTCKTWTSKALNGKIEGPADAGIALGEVTMYPQAGTHSFSPAGFETEVGEKGV